MRDWNRVGKQSKNSKFANVAWILALLEKDQPGVNVEYVSKVFAKRGFGAKKCALLKRMTISFVKGSVKSVTYMNQAIVILQNVLGGEI